MAITLERVNTLTREEFNKRFYNIMEHCPDCAEDVERKRPFSSIKHFHSSVCEFIDCSNDTIRRKILNGHPDLAGRIAQLGLLTVESNREQHLAELNTLTNGEMVTLNKLNDSYKAKFGFPFIICARENKKEAIMKGINDRLGNTVDMELIAGLEEVKKISFYRILELVEHTKEENI